MGIAGAAWGWTAAQFMASTPHEYWATYEVWSEMNRVEKEDDDGGKR
jgi:hypothetical protein